MGGDQHRECMLLLSFAKQGNEVAQQRLVDIVACSYSGMIRQYYTTDPILGREDIQNEFYWGIWRAVKEADHRGDPIFFLAQRGQWAVRSLITAVNRRRHGTKEKEGGVTVVSLDALASRDSEGAEVPAWEPQDDSVVADPQAVVEIYEARDEAHDRVMHVLVNADLTPRHIEVAQLLLDGEIDLNERFARRDLAEKLGVSGQRVTQIMRHITDRLEKADVA